MSARGAQPTLIQDIISKDAAVRADSRQTLMCLFLCCWQVSHAPGDLGRVVCPLCDNSSAHIERVAMPYVFKYLATELAAMNIKVSLQTK